MAQQAPPPRREPASQAPPEEAGPPPEATDAQPDADTTQTDAGGAQAEVDGQSEAGGAQTEAGGAQADEAGRPGTQHDPEEAAPGRAGPDINPGRDNAARLQSRAYESNFAALPSSELEGSIERPGPAGAGIDEISIPLVVIAAGCLLVLAGIFFSSFLVLGPGVVVLLAGVVWNIASRRLHR